MSAGAAPNADAASLHLDRALHYLADVSPVVRSGHVVQVVGTVVEAMVPGVVMGELATVGDGLAQVVGFRDKRALLMPLDTLDGIGHGTPVRLSGKTLRVPVGPGLRGRVIDPLGRPMDGRPLTDCPGRRALDGNAPPPMKRAPIAMAFPTGVRVVDGLLTLGEGQRVAVMAGSGVGKSTFMGMVARGCESDINVIALVGERGREVREFLERDLGEQGRRRTVVIVATSDVSAVMQVKAMYTALSVAEHFRDQGQRVLLMVDSLTRLAMAQRQIGLAAGEPPTTRGYTPSVFGLLPRLLERAGQGAGQGSITAVCTVLVEGDDLEEPVADTVRGIVDGHIVLSRRLASHGHYPPVDVLQSLSRTMKQTVSAIQVAHASRVRSMLATWEENEELVRLGAYKKGSDPEVDEAIARRPEIEAFLRQGTQEPTAFGECLDSLARVARPGAPKVDKPGAGRRSGARGAKGARRSGRGAAQVRAQ